MPSCRHDEEGESSLHVCQEIADLVDVLASQLNFVHLQDLVAFVKKAAGLGSAAADDATDDDGLALVLHGRTQWFICFFYANNLEQELILKMEI